MNSLWIRSTKIAGIIGVAILTVLLADLIASTSRTTDVELPWGLLLDEIAGARGEAVQIDTRGVVALWPIRSGDERTGTVVVTYATGYRSRVVVATALDARLEPRASVILRHNEAYYVGRAVAGDSLEAVSAASVTANAVERAREAAVQAAITYDEELR